jgi:hypothetical protein
MRIKMELKKLTTILCMLCKHEIKHSATARENLPGKNIENTSRVNHPCLAVKTLCYTIHRHPITIKNHEKVSRYSCPGQGWIRVPLEYNSEELLLWPAFLVCTYRKGL